MPKSKKKKSDPEPMEIVFVMDRSGSMQSMRCDAIGGYNAFVEEQKKEPGECRVSLLQFDDEHQVDYRGVPVAEVEEMTEATFQPRGRTALRDAIARGVALLAERAGKSLGVLAILTDGQENASKEIGREDLRALLVDCETKGWGVIYLAAGQDAVAVGQDLGIRAATSADFDGTNVKGAYLSAGANVRTMRSTGDRSKLSFSTSQRRGMVTQPSDDDLLGATEAAKDLGISRDTLIRREASGKGPPTIRTTPTAHRQYRRGSLRKYLDEQES